jgi:DNA repair photolyase
VIVREIAAKSILSKSQVSDYTVNPYVGCAHGCTYCYAKFMKRFTGHAEAWGEFVDLKANAPGLLSAEIGRKKRGRVWMSGVCDPYQPLEEKCGLTRKCLEVLCEHGWPVTVQTKSPLLLRDLDLFKKFEEAEVVLTITTADERVRKMFEPKAPPVGERLETLEVLSREGVRTCVMIAPLLPGARGLAEVLAGRVDHVLVDRMNYHFADRVYAKNGMRSAMTDAFFLLQKEELAESLEKEGIPHEFLY